MIFSDTILRLNNSPMNLILPSLRALALVRSASNSSGVFEAAAVVAGEDDDEEVESEDSAAARVGDGAEGMSILLSSNSRWH